MTIETNLEAMTRAFQHDSSFYFTGESQSRRFENWILWKEAWFAAIKFHNSSLQTEKL